MNLKLLEAFLAVIDNDTMSAAANKLFTTQPNISLMIKDLEKYYSTRLFNRISRKLYLTPEGAKLERYARQIMGNFKEMNEAMFHETKTLRIGATVTVGQYLLNDYLEKMRSKIENLKFEIVVNNTEEMERLILNNQLDVAIVEGKINSKDIIQEKIAKDELIAVISYNYPLDTAIKKLSDLERLPWISREDGSHHRNQFEIDMAQRNIHPDVAFKATNLETIIQAVEHQYGFAIISKIAAEEPLKKQSLKKLDFADYSCPRSIRYIYHKSQDDNPIILKTLECIDDEM